MRTGDEVSCTSMQVHIPDPDYTSSERARANFRLAAKIALGFVVLLWLIQLLNGGLNLELQRFGVHPREFAGLPGILLAPLLHGGFPHLVTNSLPFLGPGIAVWLFAKESTIHVGASGLVYGLVSYIFVAGVIRRDRRAIAASLLVFFLYGSMVWGVFPIQPGVSWETHLAAALIGLALAIALRRLDLPPLKRYAWEDEKDEDEDQDKEK